MSRLFYTKYFKLLQNITKYSINIAVQNSRSNSWYDSEKGLIEVPYKEQIFSKGLYFIDHIPIFFYYLNSILPHLRS